MAGMKNNLIILLGTFLLFWANQQNSNAQNVSNDKKQLPTINLDQKYPQKNIVIQNIATVEYIPLETTENSLFKYLEIGAITDSLIINFDRDGNVFVFNRKGKFLNTFNRKGGAGHEYRSLYNLCFDNTTKEIFIEEFGVQCRIYVYTLKGQFKRKFNLPENIWPSIMQNYDSDYLLCYDSYELTKPNIKTKNTPYFFLSKKNGAISPLNYSIKVKIRNTITKMQGNLVTNFTINAYPVIKNDKEFILADFGSDTIYSIKGKALTPMMLKKPFIQKNNPTDILSVDLLTNKYLLMRSTKRKYEGGNPETKRFGYDRAENKFYDLIFLNADWESKNDIKIDNVPDLPYNFAYRALPADMLITLNEEGRLKGKLKDIASKLQEDDNPILMLINFNK